MSGMTIMILGILVLILSTAGAVLAEWRLRVKKRRLREQVYHIYL